MDDRFGRIPAGAAAATRHATKTALRTLLAISEFVGSDWCAWPSLETLSKRSGLPRPRLSEGFAELQSLGLVEHVGWVSRVKIWRILSAAPATPDSYAQPELSGGDISAQPETSKADDYAQPESRITPSRNDDYAQPEPEQTTTAIEQTTKVEQFPEGPPGRLPKDWSKLAAKVGKWACDKVGSRPTQGQLGKIRELMKLWVGTTVEGELRKGEFWAACLQRARTWFNPAKAGICTVLATEAERELQRIKRNQAAEVDESEERSRNLVHQAESEHKWALQQRAAAGDKEAIAELYGEEEQDAA